MPPKLTKKIYQRCVGKYPISVTTPILLYKVNVVRYLHAVKLNALKFLTTGWRQIATFIAEISHSVRVYVEPNAFVSLEALFSRI